MATYVPQLAHRLRTHGLDRTIGFTLQLRQKRGIFRSQPRHYVTVDRYALGAVPSRMVKLYDLHQEVRSYLLKNSSWVPYHMVERFGQLTRRADALFTAYATPGLEPSERDEVEYSGAVAAARVMEHLDYLLQELRIESHREGAANGFAEAQRTFEALRRETAVEDRAYAKLSEAYRRHMSGSPMEAELS